MDTEEMSRRGAEDAEHGDLNPFYYQHYYHYRRGFDRIRRQRRSRTMRGWLAAAVGVGLVVTTAVFFLLRSPKSQEPPTTGIALATIAVTATPRPLFPTPTLPPTATTQAEQTTGLQINGFAIVSNTAGKSLRARSKPSLTAQIQATFREGERVQLLEGPVDADGLRWWRVEGEQGSGWSAELSPNGDTLLAPAT